MGQHRRTSGQDITFVLSSTNTGGTHLQFVVDSLVLTESGRAGFQLVITPNEANPGTCDFTWESRDGKVYDLLSSTDLSTPVST